MTSFLEWIIFGVSGNRCKHTAVQLGGLSMLELRNAALVSSA